MGGGDFGGVKNGKREREQKLYCNSIQEKKREKSNPRTGDGEKTSAEEETTGRELVSVRYFRKKGNSGGYEKKGDTEGRGSPMGYKDFI